MPQAPPFLWLLVGPNGAGKSTYYARTVAPHLALPFVNADLIARDRWPRAHERHAYEAGRLAARTRGRLIRLRRSFVAETVFSHPAKLDLIRDAKAAGYLVWVSFIAVATADLAVARVGQRVNEGGHPVPPHKVRGRYENLKANVVKAIEEVDRLIVVDNSEKGAALRDVLLFERGCLAWRNKNLPAWASAMFGGYLPRPVGP